MAWDLSRATSAACSRRLAMRTRSGTFSSSMASHSGPLEQFDVSVTITGACWWQCAKLLMPRTVETVTFVFNKAVTVWRGCTLPEVDGDTHAV